MKRPSSGKTDHSIIGVFVINGKANVKIIQIGTISNQEIPKSISLSDSSLDSRFKKVLSHALQNSISYESNTKIGSEINSIHNQGSTAKTYDLTNREKEVLALLVKGLTRKEIAGKLFISCNTTGTHIKNIYQKMGVNNCGSAVAKALNEDILALK